MIERWKSVSFEPFSDIYMISSHGRLKRKERNFIAKDGSKRYYPERILKLRDNSFKKKIFAELNMTIDDKLYRKSIYVDYEVAKLFLKKKYPARMVVLNHIDGDYGNNKVNNLEWSLKKEYQKNNFIKRIFNLKLKKWK